MRICIDFDGTIHDPYDVLPGYKMGQPVHGAREAIKRFRGQGHTVLVCTARPDVRHVEDWLRYFAIAVDAVSHTKPLADVYIDDRGLRFTDWPATIAAMWFLDDGLGSGHGSTRANRKTPEHIVTERARRADDDHPF